MQRRYFIGAFDHPELKGKDGSEPGHETVGFQGWLDLDMFGHVLDTSRMHENLRDREQWARLHHGQLDTESRQLVFRKTYVYSHARGLTLTIQYSFEWANTPDQHTAMVGTWEFWDTNRNQPLCPDGHYVPPGGGMHVAATGQAWLAWAPKMTLVEPEHTIVIVEL
jgi:hypothetical protein